MILMGEPQANLMSLDCRCELVSEARTKTGNELLNKDYITLTFKMLKKYYRLIFDRSNRDKKLQQKILLQLENF
jgi:hypothetical protein